MINAGEWDSAVDYFDDNHGKKVRITTTDGSIYDDIIDGYGEDENSLGESVWALHTNRRIFLMEQVEKIEYVF